MSIFGRPVSLLEVIKVDFPQRGCHAINLKFSLVTSLRLPSTFQLIRVAVDADHSTMYTIYRFNRTGALLVHILCNWNNSGQEKEITVDTNLPYVCPNSFNESTWT